MLDSPVRLLKLLRKKPDDWWTLSHPSWLRAHAGSLLCPKCYNNLPHADGLSYDIQLMQIPPHRSIGAADRGGVTVVRTDLAEILRPHLIDTGWGQCFDNDNKLIRNQVCFNSRKRIRIRGSKASQWNKPPYTCPECRRVFVSQEGPPTVLRRDLDGRHAYQTQIKETLVSEQLAASTDWTPFRDIKLAEVRIVDEPLDELPAEMPPFANAREAGQ